MVDILSVFPLRELAFLSHQVSITTFWLRSGLCAHLPFFTVTFEYIHTTQLEICMLISPVVTVSSRMKQKGRFMLHFLSFLLWCLAETAVPNIPFSTSVCTPPPWFHLAMLLSSLLLSQLYGFIYFFYFSRLISQTRSVSIIPSQDSCLRLFTMHFYLLRLPECYVLCLHVLQSWHE